MHSPNYVGHDITTESEAATVAVGPTAKHSELVTELWLDEPFMRQLHRIAARWTGRSSSALPTQELVSDTVTDLLTGKFDLSATTAARDEVRREVKRRAKAILRRRKTEPIALDDAAEDVWLDRSHEPEPRNERLDEELLPMILELAKDDLPVRTLLDLYEVRVLLAGTIPYRRDVLKLGMKKWIYDRARTRLIEYAEAALVARREAAAVDQLEDPASAEELR